MNRHTPNSINRRAACSSPSQSGFTLIEVLVSVVVLSIGLVGVAALQGVSLKNTQTAFMRSQATALAYDLADRMRANVIGAKAGLYDPDTAVTVAACNSTTGCTAQDMTKNDLAEWKAAIATYLPMGQGYVCLDSTPTDGVSATSPACDGNGGQFAVKIWWDENRDGEMENDNTATNPERLAVTVEL